MDDITAEKFNTSLSTIMKSEITRDALDRHVDFCHQINRPFEAYRAWRLWCSQNSMDAFGWESAAVTASNAGFLEEAVYCAIEFMKVDPRDQEAEFRALLLLATNAPFVSSVDQAQINLINQMYTQRLRRNPHLAQIPPFPEKSPTQIKKIYKIGYFWDFFGKSVEFCFPFHHDRSKFTVFAIVSGVTACTADKIGVDGVIEIPDDDFIGAARILRASEIDILIDLNGRATNTYGDLIFEARMAPLQASYGNFFCSTHSPAIDALIGDQELLNQLALQSCSEALIACPETFMPVWNPFRVGPKSKIGIPPRRYKYRIGATGNYWKFSLVFLQFVAEILKKIPDSSFFYSSLPREENAEYIKSLLIKLGVAPDRIELFAQGDIDYFSMIHEIDVAVDSIPYNGHLSTYEFLSQGTPVWSLSGPRLTQQYGAMLLGYLGRSEWVFDRPDALIADLAANIQVKTPEAAAKLRDHVAESGLADPMRATRLFEAALETLISSSGR